MNYQSIAALAAEENQMVLDGRFLEAIKKFFVPDCKSIDFDGTVTYTHEDKMKRAVAITDKIKHINNIILHHSSVDGNIAFAEFTFDFEMKDGSSIYWHEVIRTVWKDGKIIEEQYFKS
jgi:hypothetical protein